MGCRNSNKRKNYVASEWNIKKFTNNRFDNIKLNENQSPVVDDRNYTILNNDFLNANLSNSNLLIFENNLSFENLTLMINHLKIFILCLMKMKLVK